MPSGTNPHGVVFADLDGDQRLDLAVANSGSNNVSVRRGLGDGTFGAPRTHAVGLAPKSVVAADIDGNGILDLATANQNAGTVSVLIGTGAADFAAAVSYPACSHPHELAATDLNGDGRRDLAVPCWGGTVVSVLLNSGSGRFGAAVNYGTEADPHSVAVADFNVDGRPDLAVANHGSGSVSVLLGNGNGTFANDVVYSVGTSPHSIRTADLDGDGRADLVTANDGSDNVSVLRGNGNGTFAAATSFPTGKVPKSVLIADVSGDGKLDLVTANTAGNYPSGTLNPGGDEISVLLGDGAGKFGWPRPYTVGHTPFAVTAADVDGNGQLDLATANYFSGDVSLLLNPSPAALPPGFTESVVLGGLEQPTVVRFAPDGRVFVAEKSGLVKVFDSLTDPSASIFADLSTKVHNFWDRGLLGLALDPNFPANPYVYVLYTHDAAIGGQAPRWGTPGVLSDVCPSPPGPTAQGCVVSGRVSRLTASGNTMSGPEQVLLEGWCQQYPGHSVGALAFGPDGALYVSGGDGANFNVADYGQNGNPCDDPPGPKGTDLTPPNGEGGALRSQDLRTRGDAVGFNGSLLRIDPATGAGFPGNPLAADADADARRIVAHGFRNPFRFAVKPGTNEVWVADVGWNDAEEINSVTPGQLHNFGWPCYEGGARQSAYDGLDLALCENLYGAPAAVRQPHFTYADGQPVFPGDTCSSARGTSLSGIAFYAGGTYPSRYNGALFFSDYSRRCIWALIDGSPTRPEAFATAASGPVDLQIGPGGDLFYVDIESGTVRRIRYAPPGPPQTGTSFVSDLAFVTATNGWGPVERDRSNNEQSGGDGGPLTIGGTVYAKGLGTHSVSDVTIALAGSCSSFRATVGIDDEVGSLGAVRFAVYGDDVQLWQSPVLTGASAPMPVDVDISGRSLLRLSVSDGGDGLDYDHADWAEARVDCGGGDAAPTVSSTAPVGGATGVAASIRPAATFSEAMSATSVTAETFRLRRQGASAEVSASVAYDAATRTATLTPAGPLEAGATYTATVAGGAAGVKDAGGTPLAADYTWTFAVAVGSNTAPRPTIATPSAAMRWSVGETIAFSGSAVDTEDGALGAAKLSWALILHHCGSSGCHAHPIQTFDSVASGSFAAPDHENPSYLELRLTATDSGGLAGVTSLRIDPRTVDLTFTSSPSGLNLVFGSTSTATTFVRTVIVGSQTTIGAPSPQVSGGQTFTFDSWAHGGAQTQGITAPATNTTYTATFTGSGSTPTTTYIGDMPWTSSTNGWGPVERNASNGEASAGDGGPLTLNGTLFSKGIGAHAPSEVALALGGSCSRFLATVGLDDEVGSLGSVTFQVLGDGVLLWESPVVTGSMATVLADVDISGRSSLRLAITDGGDNINFDHADWADARIVCGGGGGGDTTPPTVSGVAPAAGATGVAASVRPTATFSEPMAAASLTSATFTLRRQGSGTDVGAAVAYDPATRTTTLAPAVALDPGATYTARVLGGSSGAKDTAGNALAGDYSWTFTTAGGSVRAFPSNVAIETGAAASGNAASLVADDGNHFLVNSTWSGTRTTSWYGVISGVTNSLGALSVSYRGSNSATCTQTIAVWRWTAGSWTTVSSASAGTSEVSRFGLVPAGPAADYVSGTTGSGDVRVRVRCTRAANFTARGEQLFIDYAP